MNMVRLCCVGLMALGMSACNLESEGDLVFKFHFDGEGERLNNLGVPEAMPEGHAGQDPAFRGLSAHYIELVDDPYTPVGDGLILYQGAETTLGGGAAIDFREAVIVGEGEEFARIPLRDLTSGSYPYFRISLSYQNFDIDLKAENGEVYPTTLASFVGYNTYIESFTLNEETIEVNGNKLQGYWGLEILGNTLQGQTPEGATTVPNPFWDSAPIPQGSCIVTGAFDKPLTFSEDMDDDVVLNVHITTNQSFEWIDVIPDGVWEPSAEENVVDMGTRGIRAEVEE